jgi:hypothetical protein
MCAGSPDTTFRAFPDLRIEALDGPPFLHPNPTAAGDRVPARNWHAHRPVGFSGLAATGITIASRVSTCSSSARIASAEW